MKIFKLIGIYMEKKEYINKNYVSNCCGAETGEECNGVALCLECKEWCEVVELLDDKTEGVFGDMDKVVDKFMGDIEDILKILRVKEE